MNPYIILLVFMAESFFSARGQFMTLKGTNSSLMSYQNLNLHKYLSPFDQTYIGDIEFVDGKFEYSLKNKEVDVYMIENPSNKHFVLFIWDGELTLQVDTLNFWNSKIEGSKLTDEMNDYGEVVQKLFFDPIRKLDTLIEYHRKHPKELQYKDLIEKLENERNLAIKKSQKDFQSYNRTYIKNHTSSFFSLYLLDKICLFEVKEEDKKLFDLLSDKLKNHSRAARFRE